MAKYLALMGSHRKNMNTNQALDLFLKGVSDNGDTYDKLYLRDLNIRHCTGCDYCSKTGQCVFKDDMQMIYEKLDNCDAVVVSSPIYCNSVNSLTKTVLDRSQRYWGIKFGYGREKIEIRRKVGIFIGVGGAKFTHNQFDAAILVMDMFFKTINAEFRGAYLLSETDESSVESRENISKELENIGKNLLNMKKFNVLKIE